jgi:hypothetical protein
MGLFISALENIMNPEQLLDPELINTYVIPWGIRVVLALAILIFGRWVNSGDHWTVRADLRERIKLSFDDNGISIPYPQRDVHLHNAA